MIKKDIRKIYTVWLWICLRQYLVGCRKLIGIFAAGIRKERIRLIPLILLIAIKNLDSLLVLKNRWSYRGDSLSSVPLNQIFNHTIVFDYLLIV